MLLRLLAPLDSMASSLAAPVQGNTGVVSLLRRRETAVLDFVPAPPNEGYEDFSLQKEAGF